MEDWEVGAQAMEVRLQQELFRQQEQGQPHSPYEHELPILDCVRRGSYKVLEGEVWAIPPMGRIGTMSLDATQQRLYEFVTWATMVTRFAVEGGLDVETAYINRLHCLWWRSIVHLVHNICAHYLKRKQEAP